MKIYYKIYKRGKNLKQNTIKIIDNLIKKYPDLNNLHSKIVDSIKIIKECYENNGKILICGNGGSAADAEHIVGELMKGFLLPRKLSEKNKQDIKNLFPESSEYLIENLQEALPAISLVSQSAIQTAFANDNAPDLTFAQQVLGYGQKNDILIAISTSGNSKNVLYAAQIAKTKNMKTISLTGEHGGKLKNLSDINLNAPSNMTFEIQEYHLPIYHTICACIENEFFGE
jgi:D-sedoheptulose 7-phosphate isomerase